MYLINETYFQREYFIPNADDQSRDAYKELIMFIDDKSRYLIKNLLGISLFNDFNQYVVNGVLENTAPIKWQNLVNGCSYEKDGKTYYWGGLLKQDGAFKNSLLVPFIYYFWLKNNQSVLTGVGEVDLVAKNGINVNSNERLVSAWNDFVEQYQGCYSNIYNHSVINGVAFLDYFDENNEVNLIKFISDNEVEYPKASLMIYEYKNQLGI